MKWLLVAGIVLMGQPALAAQNDLVVDFGAAGLWLRYNNTTWKKIDRQSPIAVAVCDFEQIPPDDVIASFPGRGLSLLPITHNGNKIWPWRPLHTVTPNEILAADFDGNNACDIAGLEVKPGAPFPTGELIKNLNFDISASGWVHRTATGLLTIGAADLDTLPHDEFIRSQSTDVGFEAFVTYNSNDRSTVPLVGALRIFKVAAGDLDGSGIDELVYTTANLGSELFVKYDYPNPPPGKDGLLFTGRVTALVVGNIDADAREDVLVGNGNGVWAYYNDTPPFVRLDTRATKVLAIADLDSNGTNDIVASFGPSSSQPGTAVRYNNAGAFTLFSTTPAELLVPGQFDGS